jgi:hypothetical protein
MKNSFLYHYVNINYIRNKCADIRAFLFPPPPLPAQLAAANAFSALAPAVDALEAAAPARPDVLGFVECKLDPDEPDSEPLLPFAGYQWHLFPQKRNSGGLAFLARAGLPRAERLDLSYNVRHAAFQAVPRADSAAAAATARNCAVVWLSVRPEGCEECLLGLLYFHPSADMEDFDSCAASIRAAVATDLPVFLQGDFNEHCSDWGDARAEPSTHAGRFVALFEELALDVLNPLFPESLGVVTRPDYGLADSGAVIDLAVSTHAHLVGGLAVLASAETALPSDHSSLQLAIRLMQPVHAAADSEAEPSAERCSFNMRKADWPRFSTLSAEFLADPEVSAYFAALRACPAGVDSTQQCRCAPGSRPEKALQAAWAAFRAVLLDAAGCAIPERRACRYSKFWWNYPGGDLIAVHRAFKDALAVLRRQPACVEARRVLAERRKSWRRMVREAHSWQQEQRCAELQKDPQAALNWRAYLRHTGRKGADASSLASVVNPADGSLPASPLEAANNLAEHFRATCHLPAIPLEPPGRREAADSPAAHHQNVLRWLADEGARTAADTRRHPTMDALFTLRELQDHLKTLRSKATGADSISTLFLQHGGAAVQEALLLLFNFSWVHGCMPLDWRSAEVVPLYKGKGERSDANNYRPISLTSCAVRCLEGLIHARLYPLVERLGMLSPHQYGFRLGRGTQDALFVLTEWIKERFRCADSRASVLAAFLDLAKAYDRTWQDGVLYRLAHGPIDGAGAGVAGRAWAWIRAFLTGRRFRVRAGRFYSLWILIFASVPQGAVLSPLLFAIFLDPLLRELASAALYRSIPGVPGLHAAIHAQLFADDVAVAVNTRCDDWAGALQKALDCCADFAARWRLSFSTAAGKSALVHFHRSAVAPVTRAFFLAGAQLVLQATYKYLGVLLYEKLSWTPHFQQLLRRAQFATFQLQRMIPSLLYGAKLGNRSIRATNTAARRIAGPHFKAVRALLLGAVYARVSYGVQFMSGSGVAAMMDRLEAVAVRPLRVALALPGSATIRGILAETDIPSLQLFRQQLLLSFARRTLSADASLPSRQLLEASRKALRTIGMRGRFHPDPRNTSTTTLVSHASENRRPMLYDILEAEHRWGVQVLPAEPGRCLKPADLPKPGAQLSCAQVEQMHGHASTAAIPARAASAVPRNPFSYHSAAAGGSGVLGRSVDDSPADDKSRLNLSLLARQRSFAEWQAAGGGSAMLRKLKTRAGRSWYLYLEARSTAVLRTRLRFNRAALAAPLAERGIVASPVCTLHKVCKQQKSAQSIEHVLLHCPALQDARNRCRNQLQKKANIPLTIEVLLGDVRPEKVPKAARGGAAAGGAAAPMAPLMPIHFPDRGLPRPVAQPPAAGSEPARSPQRDCKIAIATLFITASFLRHLQHLLKGYL